MKKPFYIVAALLAAGCAVCASGCSSGNTKNLAVLSSNWYSGTGYGGFQPTICKENFDAEKPNVGAEKITYSVKHEPMSESYQNKRYSVSYGEGGTYTTEFYADTFNAGAYNFPEEYKTAYAAAGKITAYYYKTELSIPSVTYTLKATKNREEQTETFGEGENHIVTECWFLSVKDFLRPLYSIQTVKSVSPNQLQPAKLEDGYAYKKYDRVYENFYSYDGGSVKTVTTDNLAKDDKTSVTEASFGKVKNSLFDLNSLDILARAQNLSAGSGLSQAISLYISKSGKAENFNFAGSTSALLSDEEQNKQLTSELETKLGVKGLYTPNDHGLQTVAITLHYNSAQSGGSQTYWFAAPSGGKHNNQGRATMLKLSQPISYNLGSITYTLDSFESTLWNG